MVLWSEIIFSRPAGIKEKIKKDLNVVGHANMRKSRDIPPGNLEGKEMDGVDRIKKLNLLEEKQYILIIK